MVPGVLFFSLFACDGGGLFGENVTWYADIEPIVQRNCVHCHNSEGIGPEWVGDFEQASENVTQLNAWLQTGDMPPPTSDPECQDYVGSEHLSLPEADRELFAQWEADGARKGREADAVMIERQSVHLTDYDLELPMKVEHVVDVDGDDNAYHCFVLDVDNLEDLYITAMDMVPGNSAVTHHAVLFMVPGGDTSASYGLESGLQDFDCRRDIFAEEWQFVHGWAPGMVPTVFEEDVGIRVPAGAELVLQMHYYNDGDQAEVDRSHYAVRTSDSVSTQLIMYPVGPYSFRIPAGDPDYTASFSLYNEYLPFRIHAMFPHMHKLGSRYEARLEHEDASETCLTRGDWDFENQITYVYPEPLYVDVGDTVYTECTWDNSDGDQDVRFGEATEDEMCLFFSYLSY